MADPLSRLRPLLAERFRFERPLGTGGSASVHLAQDLRMGRPVAIKILSLAGDDSLQRFVREVRALAQLQHPNLVRLYDADQMGGIPFMVSEYMEGGTLRERMLARTRIPAAEAVGWIAECLAGLEACHRAGYLHRDLKPENILFTADGHAKVADLGLVTTTAPGVTVLTQTGAFLGTPLYASPEQVTGAPAVAASDLYSIGAVLYEMLAGRPPFLANGVHALLEKHVSAEPPPLAELAPEVPPRIADAVHTALAKSPAARPASAQALLAMLKRGLTAPGRRVSRPEAVIGGTSAPGETTAAPALPPRRSLAAGPALAALALAALCGALAVGLRSRAPDLAPAPAPVLAASGSASPVAAPSPAPPDDAGPPEDAEPVPLEPWPGTRLLLVLPCAGPADRVAFTGDEGALVQLPGRPPVPMGRAELPGEIGLKIGVNWILAAPGAPRARAYRRQGATCPPPPPPGPGAARRIELISRVHTRMREALTEVTGTDPRQLLASLGLPAGDPLTPAVGYWIEFDSDDVFSKMSAQLKDGSDDDLWSARITGERAAAMVDAAQAAIEHNRDRWDAWYLVGFALRRMLQLPPARVALRESVRLDPANPLVWLELGRVERRLFWQHRTARHRRAALDALRTAQRLLPKKGGVPWLNAEIAVEIAGIEK